MSGEGSRVIPRVDSGVDVGADHRMEQGSRAGTTIGVPKPSRLEIEGARVAAELGLDVSDFRRMMTEGRIALLCERGTGEDDGTYRASFYHGKKRARFIIDRMGRVLPA